MKKFAVLGMDVEDWYHLDYFDKEECDATQSTMDGLDIYLDILEKYQIKSTFFVVGELVEKYKDQLSRIISRGHEIALHSYSHKRPMSMSLEEFKEDTIKGLSVIERELNIKPQGYRAPCFSLDRERLNILEEMGFVYDSSKIKFDAHDLYGRIDLSDFKNITSDIYEKNGFKEFEASTVNIFGKNIPISGGGYLRIFPWRLTKILLKKYFKQNGNYFFYIHPFEFSENYDIKEPVGTDLKTKLRFRLGRKSVSVKMEKLIELLKKNDYHFVTFNEIININKIGK